MPAFVDEDCLDQFENPVCNLAMYQRALSSESEMLYLDDLDRWTGLVIYEDYLIQGLKDYTEVLVLNTKTEKVVLVCLLAEAPDVGVKLPIMLTTIWSDASDPHIIGIASNLCKGLLNIHKAIVADGHQTPLGAQLTLSVMKDALWHRCDVYYLDCNGDEVVRTKVNSNQELYALKSTAWGENKSVDSNKYHLKLFAVSLGNRYLSNPNPLNRLSDRFKKNVLAALPEYLKTACLFRGDTLVIRDESKVEPWGDILIIKFDCSGLALGYEVWNGDISHSFGAIDIDMEYELMPQLFAIILKAAGGVIHLSNYLSSAGEWIMGEPEALEPEPYRFVDGGFIPLGADSGFYGAYVISSEITEREFYDHETRASLIYDN